LFPGNRRVLSLRGPPPNTVLVKTGGNALQAVPQTVLEPLHERRLVAVTVPENVSPGSTIYVQYYRRGTTTTDNSASSLELLEATVPARALPGHTFFVKIPDTQENPGPIAATAELLVPGSAELLVRGQPAAGDLALHEEPANDPNAKHDIV
jgi:hypothetical protein